MLFDTYKNPLLLSLLYRQAAENFCNLAILKSRKNTEISNFVGKELEVVEKIGNTSRTKKIIDHATGLICSVRSELPELLSARNCVTMARQLDQLQKK